MSDLILRAGRRALTLGKVPRVAGALSSFPRVPWPRIKLPCELVEVRLVLTGLKKDWLERCRAIERSGTPVMLTVRLKSEGGKWGSPDRDRLPIFEQALRHLSCVDVELHSEISVEVANSARRRG